MDVFTVAVIVATVWVALVLVSLALCNAAARSDRASERMRSVPLL